MLETVSWDVGTARLLTRLPRAAPGARSSSPTAAPDRGRWSARATCARTRAWPAPPTARPAPSWTSTPPYAGPGTGWDLHEYRHSGLTELGVQDTSLLMLMAKSRHKKPENVRRYSKPSHAAISKLTSPHAPGDAPRRVTSLGRTGDPARSAADAPAPSPFALRGDPGCRAGHPPVRTRPYFSFSRCG